MVVMGCVSITSTVVVLHVYYKNNSKEIPPMIRYVVLSSLSQRLILRHLVTFNGSHRKIIPNGNVSRKSLPTLSEEVQSDSIRQPDGQDTVPEIQTVNGRDIFLKESNNTDRKPCEENKKCSWKDVAMFLDRIMFYLLAFCMLCICLYVVIDYILQ